MTISTRYRWRKLRPTYLLLRNHRFISIRAPSARAARKIGSMIYTAVFQINQSYGDEILRRTCQR